jgi:hypothetical protein
MLQKDFIFFLTDSAHFSFKFITQILKIETIMKNNIIVQSVADNCSIG